MICLKPKPRQTFLICRIQSKEQFLLENNFLTKREGRGLKKKQKKVFLTVLDAVIKGGSHNVNKKAMSWIESLWENWEYGN